MPTFTPILVRLFEHLYALCHFYYSKTTQILTIIFNLVYYKIHEFFVKTKSYQMTFNWI